MYINEELPLIFINVIKVNTFMNKTVKRNSMDFAS